jgi:hypothetical protein
MHHFLMLLCCIMQLFCWFSLSDVNIKAHVVDFRHQPSHIYAALWLLHTCSLVSERRGFEKVLQQCFWVHVVLF